MSVANLDVGEIEPGWVWLAGAGPGDPGLLTLRAAAGLASADCVVYDALVSQDILDLARDGAELIHAGKRGGKPSPKQSDISATLITKAKQGLRVLRLKGGDPFVFGRGGEEALALVNASIPFRLIPGVTAGIAGPAYAGIPVTHRDANHAVTFVTGHAASGQVPDSVNWQAIAQTAPVIVLYMAVRHLDRIAKLLMDGGRSPDEPAAIIAQATTSAQTVVTGTVGTLATMGKDAKLPTPAMVIIGKVVDLRAELDWLTPIRDQVLTARPVG